MREADARAQLDSTQLNLALWHKNENKWRPRLRRRWGRTEAGSEAEAEAEAGNCKPTANDHERSKAADIKELLLTLFRLSAFSGSLSPSIRTISQLLFPRIHLLLLLLLLSLARYSNFRFFKRLRNEKLPTLLRAHLFLSSKLVL